jgi:hypothetical protein
MTNPVIRRPLHFLTAGSNIARHDILSRMSGKVPLVAALLALASAGCGTVREAAPGTPAPVIATARPQPQPTPVKKTAPRPVEPAPPSPKPAPRKPPAPDINANVTRESGNSLLVARGPKAEPVPLFRQAIVLADVRASLTGLPAEPKAEFQRGLLTLTFPRASQAQVAAAINKALTVPEVTHLRANLTP